MIILRLSAYTSFFCVFGFCSSAHSPSPSFLPFSFHSSQQNDDQETALFLACESGHSDLVSVLLRAGASPSHTDSSLLTPLHCACVGGVTEVARMVIFGAQSAPLVDVNARDSLGKSPLHYAVQNQLGDMVSFLVTEARADMNVRDNDGK